MVTLSAFADEISPDFDVQLETLKENRVGCIELRGVGGKSVMQLSDEELKDLVARAADRGVGFSSVGSPIGKFPLDGDFNEEIERMNRAIEIAHIIGCRYVRVFSYFIPEGDDPARHRDQCVAQVAKLAGICESTDVQCALENESHIYGDTGDRMLDLFQSVPSPGLVGVFDPANFVVCGERPYEDCWRKIKSRIAYFHIKDAVRGTGKIVPSGQGDGDVARILGEAIREGFDGFLSLEPHLQVAAASYGVTGPELFGTAVRALRDVLKDIGATEKKAPPAP
ncbi:MAG TPA: sugar phosphate isomerase/epimerase [Sumerlaeia bacterium]|nr:sugar phosphate isomerase/epimerase [Sumerlaeia bacterium]